ncbi:MAG: hypothetical protein LBR06_03385 [Bacteroidales bacterium]|jgi:hypothetical protein|nr:hypothetical protein [Bacteroidales bacterium]
MNLKKSFFCCLFVVGVFASCVEKGIDLNNLSTDEVLVKGDFAFPILNRSSISIREIVKRSKGEIPGDTHVTLDTTATGILAVAYVDSFSYAMEEDKNFSEAFSSLKSKVKSLSLPATGGAPVPAGAQFDIPFKFDLSTAIPSPSSQNKHVIDHVTYTSGTLTISATSLTAVSLIASDGTVYPIIGGKITITEANPLIINADDYKLRVTTTGGSGTAINVGISSDDFTVYGWFSYGFEKPVNKESVIANVADFLGDSQISFYAPQIDFAVEQSGIDIPLIFNLAKVNDLEFSDGGLDFPVESGKTITVNREAISNADDREIFSHMLSRESLGEGVGVSFAIKTKEIADITNAATRGDMQSFSTDAAMNVGITALLPLWLNEGSNLVYSDTTSLDIGGDINLVDGSKTTLRLNYTSHLPLGFSLSIAPLDADYRPLQIGGQSEKVLGDFAQADTSADGDVTVEKTGDINFELTKTEFEDLQKATYLKLGFRLFGNSASKAKLNASDFLSLKMGLVISGGFIFNNE